MGERKIKVTIDPVGKVSVEAEGFAGIECQSATQALLDKLQGRDAQLTVTAKPEMYQEVEQPQTLSN